MNIPIEYKEAKTNKKWKKCGAYVYKEVFKSIKYPFICFNCDENMYEFEVE